MKRVGFFRGALIMTAGAFIAKAAGALYKIPLTSLLGGYGTGLYQMAYPLFLLFLTLSSAGIPSALSRAIAGEIALGRETHGTMKTALKLFGLIGLAASLLMCAIAPFMSRFQGDNNLIPCYLALAPSVALVAVIAVLRGYFQGMGNMTPTAVSEALEGIFKAAVGLFVLTVVKEPQKSAVCALAAVTLSELVALVYLWRRYRGERRVISLRRARAGKLFQAAVPVMLAAALLPLSRTLDSILIVRLMRVYERRAVSLYGLFTGGALALIDLPAAFTGGLVAVAVPSVAEAFARGDDAAGRKNSACALLFSFALSVPCALFLYFFAPFTVWLLYGGLSEGDALILIKLIKLSSVSAVTLSAVNTLSACLTGMGRAKYAALSMAIAVITKIALQFVLISNPAFSVMGAAISANACYLVAFFLDSIYTWKKRIRGVKHDHGNRTGNGKRRADVTRLEGDKKRGQGVGA